jgi:hypothetical protein
MELDQLRYSAGIAFNWYSPIGPLSISHAVPLNKEADDKPSPCSSRSGRPSGARCRRSSTQVTVRADMGSLSLVVVLILPAATAGELRIGYVNMAKVIEEAPSGGRCPQKLEAEFRPRDQELGVASPGPAARRTPEEFNHHDGNGARRNAKSLP